EFVPNLFSIVLVKQEQRDFSNRTTSKAWAIKRKHNSQRWL
ncbi:MAG: hypothetical protein AVDCRST_MAG96-2211, partial [uncultured Segetibacter sp.]